MWKVALQFWNDALWVTKKLHLTSGPGITKQTYLRLIIPEELWSAVEFRMSSSVWSRNTAWSWQVAKPLTDTARDLWCLSYISLFFVFVFFSSICSKWNRVFCFGNPHASMHIWNQWSLWFKLVTLESNSCGFKSWLRYFLTLWNWARYFIFLSCSLIICEMGVNTSGSFTSVRNALSIILFFTF